MLFKEIGLGNSRLTQFEELLPPTHGLSDELPIFSFPYVKFRDEETVELNVASWLQSMFENKILFRVNCRVNSKVLGSVTISCQVFSVDFLCLTKKNPKKIVNHRSRIEPRIGIRTRIGSRTSEATKLDKISRKKLLMKKFFNTTINILKKANVHIQSFYLSCLTGKRNLLSGKRNLVG